MDNQRIKDDRRCQNASLNQPEGLEALRQAREESDALLRAADDVINRVLSRDSVLFLQQEARQHGGQ